MPQESTKRKILKILENKVTKRKLVDDVLKGIAESEDGSDSGGDISIGGDTIDELIVTGLEMAYERISSQWYALERKPYRKGFSEVVFEQDLQEEDNEDGTPPWLSPDEFVEKYRMSRQSFKALLNLIKDHPAFQRAGRRGRNQAPVQYQLLVFLFYLGRSGRGATNPMIRNVFGIGKGTARDWKKRCCAAIRSLKDAVVYWPDHDERVEIAKRMYTKYDFMNCIGTADGTLFPLATAPESDDAPDYHGRKYRYSLTVMIVNDDNRKIRYYLAGYPGSAHDNRVYRNTELAMNPVKYFGTVFFLLSDSALSNSPTVVASFKCARGHTLTIEQEAFNTLLGKPRVVSEHTIGILKARFQFLHEIPMKITNRKNSLRRILRMINCCIILHNLLIDEDDEIPESWLDGLDDDVSEIGAAVGEYDYSLPIMEQDKQDERRQRCIDYFKDMSMI